jgi:hypothetical protein
VRPWWKMSVIPVGSHADAERFVPKPYIMPSPGEYSL